MFVGRLRFIAMATILNMVTARVTEADKPAIKVKLHKKRTSMMVLISLPYLKRSKGFKTKVRINKIIPTCSPETAKICMAPALV